MSYDQIAPIGYCAVCLIRDGEKNPAVVLVKGNSLCHRHAKDGTRWLSMKEGSR